MKNNANLFNFWKDNEIFFVFIWDIEVNKLCVCVYVRVCIFIEYFIYGE